VSILKSKVIIGIDLAGKQKNPTGWAVLKNKMMETALVYTNKEILEKIAYTKPAIAAIDAPLKLPKKGLLRKADKALIKRGYRVFPPGLPSMKGLTLRATKLNKLITEKGIKTIEVHPTSTRRALNMPLKDWREIQKTLKSIGLEGSLKVCTLKSHEIDAATAALTAYLYIKGLTESLGDEEEGYIIVPKKQDWRNIKL
jgi:predicted nuclease with RNAse H fold